MVWMRGLGTYLVSRRALKTSPSCEKRWTIDILDVYGETSIPSCSVKPPKSMVEACLVWAWWECYEVQSQNQIHDPKNINYVFFFFFFFWDRRPTCQCQSTKGSWSPSKSFVKSRGDFTAGNWTANLFLESWISLHHHPVVKGCLGPQFSFVLGQKNCGPSMAKGK